MAKLNPTISAVVLTKNEEDRIATCLSSLSWVNEIIVVDNYSTDKTVEIAKRYKASVIKSESDDFAARRDLGKEKSEGEWILYVDADEQVTSKLAQEIDEMIRLPDVPENPVAYQIHRKNYYLGHAWSTIEKPERLFLKKHLMRWEGSLHESPIVDGQIGELQSELIHFTHRTLVDMVVKTNVWSETEAALRFRADHPQVVWWRLLRVMITGFSQPFIEQGGWKEGTHGLIESIYQGFSMFVTYAKLWEMQQKRKDRMMHRH